MPAYGFFDVASPTSMHVKSAAGKLFIEGGPYLYTDAIKLENAT